MAVESCIGYRSNSTPRGTANADMPTRIRIRTTEDYVDGIAPPTPDLSPKSGETYDLQGRKVQKARKGIFIQDGKKVAIK